MVKQAGSSSKIFPKLQRESEEVKVKCFNSVNTIIYKTLIRVNINSLNIPDDLLI